MRKDDRNFSDILFEIQHSANPKLICRDLPDETLQALTKVEATYPRYYPRPATEVYYERMVDREGCFHDRNRPALVHPAYRFSGRWDRQPQ